MILRSIKKRYKEGTHRAKPLTETLDWLEKIYSRAGITRVADITGLDRIGIPVFTAIRPLAAEGAISVYTGKGHVPEEAKISAIMEGIERFSGEPREIGAIKGSYESLSKSYHLIDPFTLILPRLRRYSHEEILEWINGHSLIHGGMVLVPAEAVFHPYRRENQLFRTNTNGLAVGNEIEEAILHGLLEVIERDAWSLFELGVTKGRDLRVEGCGLAEELMRKFREAAVRVYIKDITSDIGIPTISVVIDDELTKDPALLSLGVGAHLVPEIALVRALTEAAQSRLTTIHGTREDTYKAVFARRIGYERMKRLNKKWFEESGDWVSIRELQGFDSDDVLEDINHVIKKLKEANLNEVVVVDLTRNEVNIPAVRVIVPGLEVYALDKDRVGARALQMMKKSRKQ